MELVYLARLASSLKFCNTETDMTVNQGPANEESAYKVWQSYVKNAKAQGLQWPNAAQLGDPIRGMIVCGAGHYEQPTRGGDRIRETFDVQVRKVNLRASNRPPDMCETKQ